MGHLINPIAFRLNFKKSWEFKWYIKNIYYSEYLHNILNIRNYIYFYLISNEIIETGLLLSHLSIFKYNKLIIINLFIYHIDLEKVSYKFFNTIYEEYYNGLKKKRLKFSSNYFLIHNSDVFTYIFLFNKLFKINKEKGKKKFINYISKDLDIFTNELINNYNDLLVEKMNYSNNKSNIDSDNIYNNKINKIFNTNIFIYLKNRIEYIKTDKDYIIKNNFINNYFLYFFMYLCRKANFRKYKNSHDFYIKWGLITRLFIYYKNIYYKKIYNYNSFYLLLLISSYISNLFNIKRAKFYVRDFLYKILYIWICNKYFLIYFKFLSDNWKILFYYISKIKNINLNYYILSHLDITARFLTKYICFKLQKGHNLFRIINPLKRELYKLYKKSFIKKRNYKISIKNKMISYKLKFVKILNIMNIILYLLVFEFFKKNKTFISFDIIEFKQYIFNNFKSKYFKLLNIKKFISINVFYNLFIHLNNNLLFTKNIFDSYKCIEIIYNSIYTNYSILYNNIEKFRNIYTNLLFLSINFTKLYLNYNYYKILWLNLIGFKKKLLINKDINKFSFIGFKMAFKGRFSRRQRARSIWFTYGKVPLNTISSNIDYSFYTITLRNSAISVKIWINRSISQTIYDSNYKFLIKY